MTDKNKTTLSDEEFLDTGEDFDSDLDDLNDDEDFDDSEDGIFAPAPLSPRKKSNLPVIIGGVAVVALIAGGAFYYFADDKSPSAATPPVVAANTEPVDAIPSAPEDQAALPAVPEPVSDFEPPVPEDAATPTIAPPPEETPAPTIAQSPADTSAQPAPVAEAQAPADIPSPIPTDTNNVVSNDQTELLPEPVPEETAQAQPDPSALKPVPAPQKESSQVATQLPEKNELEAARETITLAKQSPTETKYFDAPEGKALTDIPPPSINPMSEPGESIVIVHKGKSSSDVIVEKGDDSNFVESRLVSANRAAKLGRNEAALQFYNELYRKNPNDPRILMGRAVTYQKLGETQKAINGYEAVLAVEPENPEAMTNLMGLIGKTKPAVALQNLLDMHEKFPRNASVAAQLGVAYSDSGNLQDGLKYLDMASKLQSDNPVHFYNMAVICERLKQPERAVQYYEKALDVYSVYGGGGDNGFSREKIYDRLASLRGN